jgi:hypothetical protein
MPSRDLDIGEVRDNLRFFLKTSRNPRSVPCETVVLSGLRIDLCDGLTAVLEEAEGWGMRRSVAHLHAPKPHLLAALRRVDTVVLSVWAETDLSAMGGATQRSANTRMVVPLVGPVHTVATRIAAVVAARPDGVVLSWPLAASEPIDVSEVGQHLDGWTAPLDAAGIPWGLKGLPACVVPACRTRPKVVWRSNNRWYVDADHQREAALLFRPDVVRYTKPDSCRRCRLTPRCDGVPQRVLPLLGPLVPIEV